MEWIERLNSVVVYIEEHITEEIEHDKLAAIAYCSSYHFQRMFAYLADVPLSEYIRRRKMSLAVADLYGGNMRIIDVALKYGYQSPTAFNRAFQSVHGIAPSLVKDGGVSLKSFPPISFKITVKGVEEMNFRIETKEAFRIVGVAEPLEKEMEKNFDIVPKMWEKAAINGTVQKLSDLMDSQPMGILGVCIGNDQAEDWRYFIAVASSHNATEPFEEYTIPAFTWAIFPGKGQCPGAIQELEKRIITDWLPTSGYEYDNGPDVEVYLTPDPQDAKFEVWIPITKKV